MGNLIIDNIDIDFEFTDLTIKDNRNGLVWTRNANLANREMNWYEAHEFIKRINAEKYAGYSDWRLPSKEELESLAKRGKLIQEKIKEGILSLKFNRIGFNNVQTYYWSNTADTADGAYFLRMDPGHVDHNLRKSDPINVWPVSSGQ